MTVVPVVVASRYRLGETLGVGGMGRVFLARDEVLDRDVAIKEIVLPEEMVAHDRDAVQHRTLREARAAARISHPNAAQVYDVIAANGSTWIVMEYVPSRSLQDVIKQDGPLDPRQVAEIGLAVLGALDAAHKAGVRHRDVKPANVLMGDDGRVVLTDFGIATIEGDGIVTSSDLVLGSPQYMSPERVRDGTTLPASDLWSLGATLYTAVEGHSPYERASVVETLTAVAAEQPAPAQRAGVLAPVLDGLLRKDPAARIDLAETRRLLETAANGETVSRSRWPWSSWRGREPETAAVPDAPAAAGPPSPPAAEAAAPPAGKSTPSAPRTAPPTQPEAPSSSGPAPRSPAGPPTSAQTPPSSATAYASDAPATAAPDAPAAGPTAPAGGPGRSAAASAAPVDGPAQPAAPSAAPAAGPAAIPAESAASAEPAAGRVATSGKPAVTPAPPAAVVSASVPVVPRQRMSEPSAVTEAGSGVGPRPKAEPEPRSTPGATPGPDSRRATRRRRSLLAAAVAALVLTGGGTTWFALHEGGDNTTPPRGAPTAAPGASAAATPTGSTATGSETGTGTGTGTTSGSQPAVPPGTAPSGTPATTPATGQAGTAAARPPLPAGWRDYRDPTGFRVYVPKGWKRSKKGTIVYFRDGKGHVLGIDQTTKPQRDPVADWRGKARYRVAAGDFPGYDEIRIASVKYWLKAADWEFTFNGSTRQHVNNRGFITSKNQAYGIYWQTTDARWKTDRDDLRLVFDSFRPKPA